MLDDDRQPADDEIVRKSQHAKSGASEPGVSLGVPNLCFRCLMRTAIRFDDEFACETHEIRSIRPDRRLPAKAIAIDPVIAQRAPKHCPALVFYDAEPARTCVKTDGTLRRLVHHGCISHPIPSPALLSSAGEGGPKGRMGSGLPHPRQAHISSATRSIRIL